MTRGGQGLVEFGHCLMITDPVSFFSFFQGNPIGDRSILPSS